jgi:ADP-heptose:LPS heptosyltransferase
MLLQGLPGRLISFFHPDLPVTAGSPEWRRDEHEVHRWCRMLKGYGIDCDPSDLDIKPPGRTAVSSAEAATLIHPGAAFAARRWPPERFSAVARSELAKGRKVVVTAGPAEVELGRRVLAGAGLGEEHLWVGGDDPFELVDIVAMADRVVCGDTGVSHVATAVASPSVILFGPTPPEWWGPPPERRWHVALWAGGHGEPNADKPDAGLLAITVDQVNAALDRLDDVVGA